MSDRSFADEALRAHNDYRRKHGVAPLRLNSNICATAQKWADHLARMDRFEHSKPADRQFNGEQMGENIAMKWSSENDAFTGNKCYA